MDYNQFSGIITIITSCFFMLSCIIGTISLYSRKAGRLVAKQDTLMENIKSIAEMQLNLKNRIRDLETIQRDLETIQRDSKFCINKKANVSVIKELVNIINTFSREYVSFKNRIEKTEKPYISLSFEKDSFEEQSITKTEFKK